MGHYATVGQASSFAQEHEAPCLGDLSDPAQSAFAAYEAGVDDVFIIDATGLVQYRLTVGVLDMNDSGHRSTVDGWVRSLL